MGNVQNSDSIQLLEIDRLVNDQVQVANLFNNFQVNITKHTGPEIYLEFIHHSIDKYKNHSSVVCIREHLEQSNKIAPFNFTEVSMETVKNKLCSIQTLKKPQVMIKSHHVF